MKKLNTKQKPPKKLTQVQANEEARKSSEAIRNAKLT
jgi:hypothetical protein